MWMFVKELQYFYFTFKVFKSHCISSVHVFEKSKSKIKMLKVSLMWHNYKKGAELTCDQAVTN